MTEVPMTVRTTLQSANIQVQQTDGKNRFSQGQGQPGTTVTKASSVVNASRESLFGSELFGM